jgi:hypothetical protein
MGITSFLDLYRLKTSPIREIYPIENSEKAVPPMATIIRASVANPANKRRLEQAIAANPTFTLFSFNKSAITGVPGFPACLPYLRVHHRKGTIFEA